MTTTRGRRGARLARVLVGFLALGGVLAGCGGDGDGDGAAPPAPGASSAAPVSTPADFVVLTPALATKALLTADDLQGNFTASNAATQANSQVGCLTATDALVGVDSDVSVRSAFVLALTDGASGVLSQIRSDADPSVLQAAIDAFGTAVSTCTSVQETTDDDVAVDLAVSTNDTVTDPSASQQVNLAATGTLTTGGKKYPYRVSFAASLVRGSLTIVAAYDLGRAASPVVPLLKALDAKVVDRLAAIS